MGGGSQMSQDLGDIWARTGEVTHRMKFGFGEGLGKVISCLRSRPHLDRLFFSTAAVLPGTHVGW